MCISNQSWQTETYKVYWNPPVTRYKTDLLTLLNSTPLFFDTFAMVIDGNEKCNRSSSLELQSLNVTERHILMLLECFLTVKDLRKSVASTVLQELIVLLMIFSFIVYYSRTAAWMEHHAHEVIYPCKSFSVVMDHMPVHTAHTLWMLPRVKWSSCKYPWSAQAVPWVYRTSTFDKLFWWIKIKKKNICEE